MRQSGVPPAPEDLYGLLGVAPSAPQEAIVHAYRRHARGSHPDARPNDPAAAARFRMLTSAYEVLGDPVRRADYDRARRIGAAGSGQTPSGAARPSPDRFGRRGGVGSDGVPAAVFLGARRPPSGPHLWVGPVRVESRLTGTPAEPRWAQTHGELLDPTPLIGFLIGVWST
jgi:molecular chaperone DnaJ